MKTIIHVNSSVIANNANSGATTPVITIRTDWSLDNVQLVNGAVILDDKGNEVARIIYMPEGSPHIGIRCWIETDYEVKTF